MLPADLDIDDEALTFGKYRGRTPNQVAEVDPSYVIWMFESVKNFQTCSPELYDACLQDEADEDDRYWPLDD
jgi:hypothetical protein